MIPAAIRSFWRAALSVFFSSIEFEGVEKVPASGPILLVPNHVNAFIDAMMVTAALDRPVTLTAKSTLFDVVLLRPFLRMAGVVPLHRRQDVGQGAEPARNAESLAACRRRLAEGGAVCIFPEGVSHSEPHLRPLRTGAARIALESAAEGTAVSIVPVGLHYEAKERFRSAARVRFGEPLDVASWARGSAGADPRALSGEVERRLREITLNFERRRDEVLVDWTALVLATGGAPPSVLGRDTGALARRAAFARRLGDGYGEIQEARPAEVRALSERVRRYHGELRRLGIAPEEVYLEMSAGPAALFLVREAEMLVIGLPLALAGTLLHAIPYLLVRALTRRLSTERDHWATNAVVIGLVVFPIAMIVEISAAWRLMARPWAAAATALVPYAGFYAVLYRDRAGGVLRRSRTFLRFLFSPRVHARLEREGRDIIASIEGLAEAAP
jgi:1-acyl-sn-glycerol-3-phosphate acyltransferase